MHEAWVSVYATRASDKYRDMTAEYAVMIYEPDARPAIPSRTVALVADPVEAEVMAIGIAAHLGYDYLPYPSVTSAVLTAYGFDPGLVPA